MSEYKDRVIKYSLMWVNGNPQHNTIDDECVIDFSCCYPRLFTANLERRQQIHASLIKKLREN